MTKTYLVVTTIGPDKRGTVEKITGIMVNHQANIEQSRMARLGGEFAVIMLVSISAEIMAKLLVELDRLKEDGLTVITRQTDLSRLRRFEGYVPYEIAVTGADHEGIVYNVAHYLAMERINVETMETNITKAPHTGTPLFSMYATMQVPPELTLGKLRQKLAELGNELGVDIEVKLLVS